MAAFIRNESALAMLYGARPSDYQGTTPPVVCEVREHARLVSVHATDHGVLVAAEVNGILHLIRALTCDQQELNVLSPTDRARVAAAVATLHRDAEVGDG